MPTKRMFVDGENGQIHLRLATPIRQVSIKTPLVCLHMSPKSGRIFQRFIDRFATDRTAIAPDYPGFGESDPPPAEPHVSIADYARNMWAVIDQLKLSKIDILGYHTGSLVAAEMTHQQSDRVNRIVMISAPVFTDEELSAVKSHFAPIALDKAGTRFTTMWKKVQFHAAKGKSLALAAESFAENLRAGENYEWGHRAAFAYAHQFPVTLSNITQRIDIINPGDVLHQQTLGIRPWLQNGDIHERPSWGHGFLDYDTDNAVKDIRKLLLLQ